MLDRENIACLANRFVHVTPQRVVGYPMITSTLLVKILNYTLSPGH